MFKSYDSKLKRLLSKGAKKGDWKVVLKQHKRMIARIQHERLIHLLVTIFVGTVLTLGSLATIITKKIVLVLLDAPLLVLFIAYLFHYRFLENTTQSWYKLEDEIEEKIN